MSGGEPLPAAHLLEVLHALVKELHGAEVEGPAGRARLACGFKYMKYGCEKKLSKGRAVLAGGAVCLCLLERWGTADKVHSPSKLAGLHQQSEPTKPT